jgi:hypothetical protein
MRNQYTVSLKIFDDVCQQNGNATATQMSEGSSKSPKDEIEGSAAIFL